MSFSLAKLFGRKVEKELPDPMQRLDEIIGELPEEQQGEIKALLVAAMASGGGMPPPPPEAPEPTAEKKEPPMPDQKPEDLAKRLEALEKGLATVGDLQKAVAAKDEEIKKLRDEIAKSVTEANRVEKRRGEIAKRAGALAKLPGKVEDIAKEIQEIEDKLGPEQAEAMLKRLELAHRLVDRSHVLGGPVGFGGGLEGEADSAVHKLAKSVVEIKGEVRKAGNATITDEKAFAKAWERMSYEEKAAFQKEMAGEA